MTPTIEGCPATVLLPVLPVSDISIDSSVPHEDEDEDEDVVDGETLSATSMTKLSGVL